MAVMADRKWFLLEEKPHRLQVSLNDVNGFDPLIHGNRVPLMIDCVRNALHSPRRSPSHAALARVHRQLTSVANREFRGPKLWTLANYRMLVALATGCAEREGLL